MWSRRQMNQACPERIYTELCRSSRIYPQGRDRQIITFYAKQTQFAGKPKMNVNNVLTRGYENKRLFRRAESKPNQTQFRALSPSTNPQLTATIPPILTASRQFLTKVSDKFYPDMLIWVNYSDSVRLTWCNPPTSSC